MRRDGYSTANIYLSVSSRLQNNAIKIKKSDLLPWQPHPEKWRTKGQAGARYPRHRNFTYATECRELESLPSVNAATASEKSLYGKPPTELLAAATQPNPEHRRTSCNVGKFPLHLVWHPEIARASRIPRNRIQRLQATPFSLFCSPEFAATLPQCWQPFLPEKMEPVL